VLDEGAALITLDELYFIVAFEGGVDVQQPLFHDMCLHSPLSRYQRRELTIAVCGVHVIAVNYRELAHTRTRQKLRSKTAHTP
jgi:hypothetical protein